PLTIRREDENQISRLEKLRVMHKATTEAQIERARTNKVCFDSQFEPDSSGKSCSTLVGYKVGDIVHLCNESHTKGEPSWFGPFKVFDCLGNNAYHLIDHSDRKQGNEQTSLFPHPISRNRLKPAKIKDSSRGDTWALPPWLNQAPGLQVPQTFKLKASKLFKAQEKARPKIKVIGRFATA
ncbi:hypothetical protein CROQUDRAFT_38400, partial [Cronartium quercuum f. sp. fusiforme G11]